MNSKTKSFMTKKRAFTLIELLIVIAIIGILFIVLVSKVDFATDKAKATGVQTDFRSFQMAFDTIAKENAGFNTFGYNTGDNAGGVTTAGGSITINGKSYTYTNALKDLGDGKRNSYDVGDDNLDGIQNGTEVFIGRKVYTETFTNVYTLMKPGTSVLDTTVLAKLEAAINANLDPKLHITIKDDGEIVMANGAQDPWNKEYHGWYISKAVEQNGADRGAIVMYSDGANGVWGSSHNIDNGVVSVTVPNSNKDGKDDYSIVSCYTYVNGYGEIKNVTTGFSNNQSFLNGQNSNLEVTPDMNTPEVPDTPDTPDIPDTPETPDTPDTPETPEIPEVTYPAMIGNQGFDSVKSALDYAYNNQIKDVEISLGGETSSSSTDVVDLYMGYNNGTAFNTIVFKQPDASKPYYLSTLYTGWTSGKVVFDGVNLVVTQHLYAIGNFEVVNNATIKRTSDNKNFVFYGNMKIEAGSKFESLVDEVSGGSHLIVDGGTYKSIFTTIAADSTMTIKNNATVVITNYESSGDLTVNGVLNIDLGNNVTTMRVLGSGKIVIDATNFTGTRTAVLKNMSAFTGTIEIVNANGATYEIVGGTLYIK